MTTDPRHQAADRDEWVAIRCQLGEPAAFDELIERWNDPIGRYIRRLTGEDEAAREAVQDTWLRVLRGITRLREPARIQVWLFGIARRTVMDRLRLKYRTPPSSALDATDIVAEEAALDLHEDLDALERQLAGLSVAERDVLTLFYLQDLSLADVSAVLDVPIGTVKSRLFRARQTLRHALNQKGSRR